MAKIQTSKLVPPALDWVVAKCEGRGGFFKFLGGTIFDDLLGEWVRPSTDWAQAGPIIEHEEIDIYCHESPKTGSGWWVAEITGTNIKAKGNTPLVAAMRCYVASKLGDEVEIPDELIK